MSWDKAHGRTGGACSSCVQGMTSDFKEQKYLGQGSWQRPGLRERAPESKFQYQAERNPGFALHLSASVCCSGISSVPGPNQFSIFSLAWDNYSCRKWCQSLLPNLVNIHACFASSLYPQFNDNARACWLRTTAARLHHCLVCFRLVGFRTFPLRNKYPPSVGVGSYPQVSGLLRIP